MNLCCDSLATVNLCCYSLATVNLRCISLATMNLCCDSLSTVNLCCTVALSCLNTGFFTCSTRTSLSNVFNNVNVNSQSKLLWSNWPKRRSRPELRGNYDKIRPIWTCWALKWNKHCLLIGLITYRSLYLLNVCSNFLVCKIILFIIKYKLFFSPYVLTIFTVSHLYELNTYIYIYTYIYKNASQ